MPAIQRRFLPRDDGPEEPRRVHPLSLLLLLLLVLLAVPAAALDTVYLVRHAEKAEGWPAARELDAFQPLSPAGTARAESLANRLKDAGIVAIYSSNTTRSLATGLPLAKATGVPLLADDATTKPDEMAAFLVKVREKHAADKAVLIVGHSNTIPELLIKLGATPECYTKVGITGEPGKLLIEGYEGLWRVDLKKEGCAAITWE